MPRKATEEAPVQEAKEEVKYPVPREYREMVDQMLNQDFGVEIEPMDGSPAFRFVVVVPPKYKSMNPANKDQINDIGGRDIRPIVLDYSMGKEGVKEWIEKVWNTFSPEVKSQISAERVLT